MLNGTLGGLRTLSFSMILISLPLYVVALVLRESLGQEHGYGKESRNSNGANSFSTLAKAYFTLFRCVVAGDCADESGRPIFVLVSQEYGWVYGCIYAFTF